MGDPASMQLIGSRLQTILIVESVALIVLLLFLAILAINVWNGYKRFQQLMSRRIRPLMNQSKALVKTSKDLGLSVMEHGKSIYATGMQAVESVELRAQTTAKVVKGAIPEAKRLPGEVAATTEDVRAGVRTAQTVAQTYKAVQSVRSMIEAAARVSAIVKATRDAAAR
ncbi:MAG: hypothetical protein LC772_08985 [Chloroflexi bacterium]|nr:hypothetical protein [Chloroflexota bacterium]